MHGRSEELSSSLTVDVPRRAAKKPIAAEKEAALRDALIARRVIPVKSTVPSKNFVHTSYLHVGYSGLGHPFHIPSNPVGFTVLTRIKIC